MACSGVVRVGIRSASIAYSHGMTPNGPGCQPVGTSDGIVNPIMQAYSTPGSRQSSNHSGGREPRALRWVGQIHQRHHQRPNLVGAWKPRGQGEIIAADALLGALAIPPPSGEIVELRVRLHTLNFPGQFAMKIRRTQLRMLMACRLPSLGLNPVVADQDGGPRRNKRRILLGSSSSSMSTDKDPSIPKTKPTPAK